ncbi:hypothetical protein HYQ46_002456 [Verticillium longisporum]|nr:hypothetical protein HYQ46_002456 [Verticillium longisporum]
MPCASLTWCCCGGDCCCSLDRRRASVPLCHMLGKQSSCLENNRVSAIDSGTLADSQGESRDRHMGKLKGKKAVAREESVCDW